MLLIFTLLAACGAGNQINAEDPDSLGSDVTTDIPSDEAAGVKNGTQQGPTGEEKDDHDTAGKNDSNTSADGTGDTDIDPAAGDKELELLQSASIDLDNDGVNEQIEAVRADIASSGGDVSGRVEGRLLIKDGDTERQIIFWEKDNDMAGILTNIQFEDLDGDGAKDVFIVVPGYGAAFSYSNCFVYSYKKDKSYSFSSDNELADFIDAFSFSYIKGGNMLSVINEKYKFSADLIIEDIAEGTQAEETMQGYIEGTWIDPVSVDISEASRLALVTNNGTAEIKIPLPVFGMATVNMIAEMDLFYRIDSEFKPVLQRCEVIDFSAEGNVKAGSFEVTDQ